MSSDRLCVVGGRAVRGRLTMPGDKSVSHRALLMAALAPGRSTVDGLSDGDDVARTRAAIEALGADVTDTDGVTQVVGGPLHEPDHVIDVGNSGTTLRLLAGVVAAQPFLTVITGDASLSSRPVERVVEPLGRMGARVDARLDSTRPICETEIAGTTVDIKGADFHDTNNEVWFTNANTTGNRADPRIRVFNVPSSSGGTLISLTIPNGAGPGDVLVKLPGGTTGRFLSNAFPFDPTTRRRFESGRGRESQQGGGFSR